jgi:phage tail-like protein
MSTSSVDASLKANLSATPNNYGVTHIAIGAIPDDVAWSTAKLVRKYSGYPQNINDGDVIYEFNNTDTVLTVSYVDVNGAILGAFPFYFFSDAQSPAPTPEQNELAIPTVAITPSLGTGAIFQGTANSSSFSIVNGGSGYAENDLIMLKLSDVNTFSETLETTEPNEYGVSGVRHVYDTLGTTAAVTLNPGKLSASKEAQDVSPPKVYYSLFVYYTREYPALLTSRLWKKVSEISCVLVKDRNTLSSLSSHIPSFYVRDSQTSSGNDLLDFLSVFAFQLDMYKAQAENVFRSTNVTIADEILLKLLLKEFGVSLADIPDISQARTLAANIVKIYKESGSVLGLQNLIESYTGYGSNIVVGRNLMLDYNSSSFEENIGFWNYNNESVLTSVGPVDGGVAVFTDGAAGYGRIVNDVTGASCATTSTTITGTFTDITPGAFLSVTSTAGTGVLAPGTVITSILSTNTFRINYPPTTALSGADLRASNNMVTGMAKLVTNTTAATTASVYLGPKKSSVLTTATSTATLTVSPSAVAVNDYIIGNNIPYGTYVITVNPATSTSQTIVLNAPVSVSLSTDLLFSRNAAEKIGAKAPLLTVIPNTPYTFSAFINSGTSVTGTTVQTASTNIIWYDRNGSILSTSNGANSSAVISTSNSNTNKWVPLVAQGVAPSLATYAEPNINITNVTSSTPWYIDAVQFENSVPVVKKEIPTATSVKLTTEVEHNFNALRYGFNTPNYVTVTGLGSPYDGTFPIASIVSPTSFTYTISSTSTAPESLAPGGLVSSNTPFEDARKLTIDVLPNRINLVTNPSFEVNTYFWGNGTNSTTAPGINCAIATSTSYTLSGVSSLQMTASSTAPMSVKGFAGSVNSGIITNYTTPFLVERSTATEDIFYTLSFYSRAETTSRNCYAKIYWYKDEAGTPSDIIPSSTSVAKTNNTSTWTRYGEPMRVPEDAISAVVEIYVASSVAGEKHFIDDVLFEKGYNLGAYFDGSFDGQNYDSVRDSVWETGGIPNACRSHYYLNRVANTGRLKTILTDGLYYA